MVSLLASAWMLTKHIVLEFGTKAASQVTGQTYGNVQLKQKDWVTSISGEKNQISVRGFDVDVNSTLLFMRVMCVIKYTSEMKDYLKNKFSKQPPSLFDKGIMHKYTKSTMANILKSKVNVHNELPEGARFIPDGGHLIQHFP